MRIRSVVGLVACLALLLPGVVVAQTATQASTQTSTTQPPREHWDYIAAYIGGDYGGDLFDSSFGDLGDAHTPSVMGAAIGFWGRGMLSGELDFAYHREFFGPKDVLAENNLLTLTASFVINPTIDLGSQRIRPYFLVGGGLMRSRIEDFAILGKDVKNKGVVDLGGGILYYFHPRVGVRGDLRYFKGVGANDDEDGWGWIESWSFMRATVGVAFTF